MEEVCIRFPFMAENILKNLDFMSLVKCMEASRKMKECLDKGRVLWKQMILKNIKGMFMLYTVGLNMCVTLKKMPAHAEHIFDTFEYF